jgi:hypothetical protein
MSDQNAIPPLSMEAAAVLEKMQAGLILVGDYGDYGRPFRLIPRSAATWENVDFVLVRELLIASLIQPKGKAGTQTEYEAVLSK